VTSISAARNLNGHVVNEPIVKSHIADGAKAQPKIAMECPCWQNHFDAAEISRAAFDAQMLRQQRPAALRIEKLHEQIVARFWLITKAALLEIILH
jgi:hypothetical protein